MGDRRGRGDEKCQRRDGDQFSKTGELGKVRQLGTDQVLERDFIKTINSGMIVLGRRRSYVSISRGNGAVTDSRSHEPWRDTEFSFSFGLL